MSGTTSVPRPTFGPNGFILPTEAEILAGVKADINAAFGGNLSPNLETPQGQIATTETAIISDQNDQFLLITQNVDPAFSSGRMQDGIARIYYLERYPARPTSVLATCRGLQGVKIPVGVLARAIDNNYYTATEAGEIGPDGTVDLPFACTVAGPISCATGALNQVAVVIPGWDSIINNADGVIGQDVENRTQFEQRRFNSVAGNSAGMLASVQGAVLNVDNVLDAYTFDNDKGSAVILDGVTLPPHSLYVCAAGGSPADIAQAIFTRKSPGCDMAGNTTVQVQDTNAGYSPPYPSYPITYQIAVPQTFVITVTLLNSPQVPSDALSQVQDAILKAWIGDDGGSRARIGTIVFASRYYAVVANLGSWAQIISIKLGSTAAPAASFTGAITGALLTVSAGSNVAANQTIVGNGVPDGVRIASLGTGTGGAGTYNLNQALTAPVPSTAMVGILPSLDDVAVGIAHVPVLSADNIAVVLAATP